MGQTKMQAVCADALGVPFEAVRVMTTATDKVPNTSPTAASSGSDLNGAAVAQACALIRQRMEPVARQVLEVAEGTPLTWAGGVVRAPDGREASFGAVATRCWVERVGLSATGYYATPGIVYDQDAGRGTPFFYFAYGVGVVEVELSGLTGELRMRRVDILHDVGSSLVPSIDRGQIEGAFVQGVGWLTDEEVLFGDDGACRTVGPSTYKVPSIGDIPEEFHVRMLEQAPQPGVIGGSKAVGEPPFMLAIGVLSAIKDALRGFGDSEPEVAIPATPEALLRAVEAQRRAE